MRLIINHLSIQFKILKKITFKNNEDVPPLLEHRTHLQLNNTGVVISHQRTQRVFLECQLSLEVDVSISDFKLVLLVGLFQQCEQLVDLDALDHQFLQFILRVEHNAEQEPVDVGSYYPSHISKSDLKLQLLVPHLVSDFEPPLLHCQHFENLELLEAEVDFPTKYAPIEPVQFYLNLSDQKRVNDLGIPPPVLPSRHGSDFLVSDLVFNLRFHVGKDVLEDLTDLVILMFHLLRALEDAEVGQIGLPPA